MLMMGEVVSWVMFWKIGWWYVELGRVLSKGCGGMVFIMVCVLMRSLERSTTLYILWLFVLMVCIGCFMCSLVLWWCSSLSVFLI